MSTKKAVVFSDGKIKRFEKIVKHQTQEKKRELHRAIDAQVDKQIDKKFILFLKDLKIKKALDKHKKTCEDLIIESRNLLPSNFSLFFLQSIKILVKSETNNIESPLFMFNFLTISSYLT